MEIAFAFKLLSSTYLQTKKFFLRRVLRRIDMFCKSPPIEKNPTEREFKNKSSMLPRHRYGRQGERAGSAFLTLVRPQLDWRDRKVGGLYGLCRCHTHHVVINSLCFPHPFVAYNRKH